jgi:hypothetical protein
VAGVSPANPTIAAATAASTVPIRDIRLIRGFPNFPRNSRPNSAQYTGERPELISHGEKSKKAKTTKGK